MLYSTSFIGTFPFYSLGALLMPGWPIEYMSNIERQKALEKAERIYMKSRVCDDLCRQEDEGCSEKSIGSWFINSTQSCVEAPEGLMGFYVFPSKVRQGKWRVLAYLLIAFTHSTGHAWDWDPHKDRNMFWAAEYPYNLDNSWEVSEYLTNKQIIKIIATIYWALTIYFTAT